MLRNTIKRLCRFTNCRKRRVPVKDRVTLLVTWHASWTQLADRYLTWRPPSTGWRHKTISSSSISHYSLKTILTALSSANALNSITATEQCKRVTQTLWYMMCGGSTLELSVRFVTYIFVRSFVRCIHVFTCYRINDNHNITAIRSLFRYYRSRY